MTVPLYQVVVNLESSLWYSMLTRNPIAFLPLGIGQGLCTSLVPLLHA